MPYGQFVAYEPAGKPGAYNFGLADGRSVSLFGPEAEDLRAKIDASNAAMPQPTAQNMSTPEQNMSVPDAQGGQNMSVGTPQPGPPAPVAVPETTVEGKPAPYLDQWGYEHHPDGTVIDPTKRSGGTTKAQLEKRAASGVATPTGETETVQGSFAPSEEYIAGVKDVYQQQQAQAVERRDRDMAVAQQAVDMARDQAVAIQAQQAEAQRANLTAEIRLNADQEKRDAAVRAYNEGRIDPGRMFRGEGGTAKAIGAALSAGLGAFGAAITKTPNFAMQMIEGAIERDVRAQEAEIAVKKQSADNALADLTKSGMSMDQAKNTLKATQLAYAAKQAEIIAGGNQVGDAQLKYKETATSLQAAQLKLLEEYRQNSIGETTKTIASKVQYAGGGSSGVVSPGQRLQIAQQEANVGATVASTQKKQGGAALPPEDLRAEQQDAEDLKRLNKVRNDLATMPIPDGETLPGFGTRDAIGRGAARLTGQPEETYTSSDGVAARDAVQHLANIKQRQLGKSDADAATARKQAQGDGTKASVLKNLDDEMQVITNRIKARRGQQR